MTTRALNPLSRIAAALLLCASAATVQGGIVTSTTANMPHNPQGFGAWNLDNVTVTVNGGGSFNETDGSYTVGDGTFDSFVDDLGPAPVLQRGVVHGKDWPVGEPSGIKVINDDLAVKQGKPTNCLMTTSYLELPDELDSGFLDTANPVQTRCSSGFQTHKRFKVNMEANSLDTAPTGGGVDLVFNVEPDATAPTRDYQIFQKINNYTGQRLEGFTVELGVGVGSGFQTASAAGLTTKLWLSIPSSIWDPEDVAPFAHGLFGPADKHFPEDGFFDDIRAGFDTVITEYDPVNNPGIGDEFHSTNTRGSNYAQVPPIVGPVEQFGPWIHSGQLPQGIFFDDDADPTTDAQLMAFWGETAAASGVFAWMQGDANGFAVIPQATIDTWAADPLYFVGPIEDLLNLGLNYMVTIGTVDATWPTWDAGTSTATFTLRMTPIEDTSGIGDPTYLANPPPPFVPPSAAGTVSITPSPTFVVSQQLVVGVADNDLVGAGTVNVSVVNQASGESEALTLSELAASQGTFSATLDTVFGAAAGANDDGTMTVDLGNVVRATYTDADNGAGGINVAVTADTTAAAGTTGVLTVTASINPGDNISVSLADADLNTRATAIDFAAVTCVDGRTGETEVVSLEETGANTGIFANVMTTVAGATAGNHSDGVMVVQAGDTLTTTYLDAAGVTGAPATVTDTTTVTAAATTSSSGGGGGGGCVLSSTDTRLNPTLPMLLGLVLVFGWRQHRRYARSSAIAESQQGE